MSTAPRRHRFVTPTAILAIALLIGASMDGVAGSAVSAQEMTPHPGHIHEGTCAELGGVVYPLETIGAGTMMGTPVAAEMMGPESAIPALVSVTTVEADLATIIAGGHAINFHQSQDDMGTYIACGDIGGAVMGNSLAIGLAELNDSGYSGVAWLQDNGDGTTTVTVFLTRSGDGNAAAEASPAASTDDEAAAAGEIAIDIVDFSFQPDPLDIAVGTTVTWTNQDSAPHTATSSDGGATFQSGTLNQGDSFSFTFEEAGTFEYFCEFHPNMVGTINVT